MLFLKRHPYENFFLPFDGIPTSFIIVLLQISAPSETKKCKSRKRQHSEQDNLSATDVDTSRFPTQLTIGLLKGYSVDEEDQFICLTLPESETLFHRTISHDQSNISTYGKLYLLCQTFYDVVPGFNLLETRMISRNVMGWPIVMATLYKQGTKEGQIHHMKALARLCSTPEEDIFSPKVKDKTVLRNPVHFRFFYPY